MPYDAIGLWTTFQIYRTSRFYRTDVVATFLQALYFTDFSSVEGRRTAIAALETFLNSARVGSTIFRVDVRFPNTMDDIYLCTQDIQFNRTMTQLQSALTVLRDIMAKDMRSSSGTRSNVADGATDELSKQGMQDAKKSFDEARNTLSTALTTPDRLVDQITFEQRALVAWTPPAQPGSPNQAL